MVEDKVMGAKDAATEAKQRQRAILHPPNLEKKIYCRFLLVKSVFFFQDISMQISNLTVLCKKSEVICTSDADLSLLVTIVVFLYINNPPPFSSNPSFFFLTI